MSFWHRIHRRGCVRDDFRGARFGGKGGPSTLQNGRERISGWQSEQRPECFILTTHYRYKEINANLCCQRQSYRNTLIKVLCNVNSTYLLSFRLAYQNRGGSDTQWSTFSTESLGAEHGTFQNGWK